ncbi:CAMK/CAMK1 protein kinase, variant 2 [Aphanomyces invadans]|uniref:CAMK/CAMK1 protein kinase, variant 2 n=1 Tax=Aphanomyces invadans TaxID=157072 RepID=A0A024UIE5_9STRA|nr:CAMK/CAMK1 protein kinase, variant 2 [Aphanomyces invadans]ETW06221.1 CAMK/CAMK1 protein kinase, variant 2 [Aphanomyces invadans]|eukprot:XP_008864296.1 CAMK/CAMK1 protein kinase, variant 2 [Aphanomyces invadans]
MERTRSCTPAWTRRTDVPSRSRPSRATTWTSFTWTRWATKSNSSTSSATTRTSSHCTPWGELFDRIVEQEYYSESEARTIVRLILQALKHCHDHDIVHRDLKPENIFLGSATDHTSVKIGDFGYAATATDLTLTTSCGTPSYVAPEILLHLPYGKPVDVWSAGVITFILLAGYMPFHGTTQVELFARIKTADYDCPDDLSADAQDFLTKMLVAAPSERYTVDQLLSHVWITGSVVPTYPLAKTRDELRRFNVRRKLRASVRAVQATDTFAKVHKVHTDGVDDCVDHHAAFLELPTTFVVSKDTTPHLPSARSWFRSMRVHPNC